MKYTEYAAALRQQRKQHAMKRHVARSRPSAMAMLFRSLAAADEMLREDEQAGEHVEAAPIGTKH